MVHLNFSEDEIFSEKFIELLSDRIKTKRMPITLKHITVFLNEDEEPPRTFFIGFKKGSQGSKNLEKISLLYINIVHENLGHKMILQSSDVDFWNDLDRKWEESRHSCKRIPGSSIFDEYIALVKK